MHRSSLGLRPDGSARTLRRYDRIIVTLHHGPALCFYVLFFLTPPPSPLTFWCHAPVALLCPPPPPNISDLRWQRAVLSVALWSQLTSIHRCHSAKQVALLSSHFLLCAYCCRSVFFFSLFFVSPPRHFPPQRVTQSNIFVNHPFLSGLFLTIMAGSTVVGCLLAAVSPFKVCFSQFDGSPIHHTLAVPVWLRAGGDLLSSWKLLLWCCHLLKRETLLSRNYRKIKVVLKKKCFCNFSAVV